MQPMIIAVLACLAVPVPKYTCASVLESVRADLRAAEANAIALANPALRAAGEEGAGERCDDFSRAAAALRKPTNGVESGTLGGRHAVVFTDGPHGSGHFSTVTVAVELDGRVVGACFSTSTSGWRNLSDGGRRLFGVWRTLVDDRLLVWSGLAAGAAEYESLISALVFRLRGDALVLDRAATGKEIGRMGRVYATPAAARADDDEAAALHRAAAAAYRALATGGACP
jgi:hypothetical protein